MSGNAHLRAPAIVEARSVLRSFGPKEALKGVSIEVKAGEVHALLGPNGAGKTTLLRILTGLLHADAGHVQVAGLDPARNARALRQQIGLVPSGDRTLYLRISGLENLVFFARLYGIRRREAAARASEVLRRVGLADAARVRVGVYSHGMQKRLLVARALIPEPSVLLVDEATHDLDPEAARSVRELIRENAARGVAVLWTTQRVEEIRGFADTVTLLDHGETRFSGTVTSLMAHAFPRRYVLQLRNGGQEGAALEQSLAAALANLGTISAADGATSDHYVLSLADDALLGDALGALREASVDLLTCREERSEIEEAFLALTTERTP
jgi:ABC-2 type transport system ATP-binding protein